MSAVSDPDPIDVVTSVAELDPVVVLLREFLHRSGAARAVAIVDQGDDAAVVDCEQLVPIEVTSAGRTVALPHDVALDAVALPVPDVRQLPRFEVSAERGEVAAPLGGLEHYAEAVQALADAIPGPRSAALATWATTDPETPLSITARPGEPYVVSLGDEQFEIGQ